MVVVTINRIESRPGAGADLERLFAGRSGEIAGARGLRRSEFLRSTRGGL